MISGGKPGHARLVGGGLAGLADDQVDLGLGLRDDLLDPAGVDPAVADELRQRDPGDLAADGVEAAEDHGLGRVVDDQVDAGRLLEGPDVAALAADDPALHLVVRQVDDRHRVLRGVVGGDALDRGDHDVAGLLVGLVAGLALDRPGELDRVVLGLLADRLEEERLGVLGRHAADPLERRDLLLVGLRDGLPGGLELALAVEELAVALLEHVGPLVELLVALEEPALERRELVALRPGLVLRLALEAQLLVLRLEDQLLLAGARLGLDPAPLGLGRLHRLRGPVAAGKHANDGSSDGRDHGHRNENQRFHSSSSRPVASDRRMSFDRTARSRVGTGTVLSGRRTACFRSGRVLRCGRRSGSATVVCG